MQKKTLGWEPSTETMYPADGGLEGRCDKALKLVGGGHLHVNFKTTYKSKKPVKMPGVHYVDRRLERIKEADNETYVEQYEHAVARYSNLGGGMDELYKCFVRSCGSCRCGSGRIQALENEYSHFRRDYSCYHLASSRRLSQIWLQG